MRILKQLLFILIGIVILVQTQSVFACPTGQTSCSSNYSVDQTFFGSGGELNACSTSYCSKQTAGELAVGNSASATYQVQAGFNTTDVPFIEFVATGGATDLGVLSRSTVATTTGTFYVRAWQSGGYSVTAASSPPSNSGHLMTALSSPTASSPGTEQFGINLIKNTNFCGAGCNLGADPAQVPNSSFSFGSASAGYNTANLFKYLKGDVVASSASSTSITQYTVSYIFNISSVTPGGTFKYVQNLVATGTY